MRMSRPKFNLPTINLRRPNFSGGDAARRKKWLTIAGYAAVGLFLLIALVIISHAPSKATAQPAAFVNNGSGGMSAISSGSFSQPQMAQSSSQPVANANLGAAVANLAGNADRPSVSPLDPSRSDWSIVKDYAANGGPGNRGAVEIAFASGGLGSSVNATHAGLVKTLHNDPTYGNLVYVIGNGYTTIYGHLQSISISDGQPVKRGDIIGTMGSSGAAGGPELNYQVWQCSGDPQSSGTAARSCTNVNPTDYLK